MGSFSHTVASVEGLRELYREPSKVVQAKKVTRIDEVTSAFLAASPFCLLATANGEGRCDVSPKGGPAGFVKVLDESRIAIPDLNGNNLIDSLQNIVGNGHAGLLCLMPGRDETLRIDGTAVITTDPEILALWDDELRRPKAAIGITVEQAFIHCAKSFRRGGVWEPDSWTSYEGAPDGCDLLASHLGLGEERASDIRANLEAGYAAQLAEDRPE